MSLKINWFIKGRRAQSVDDYETWNEGGVVPTLNLGDNTGDTRATVLILMESGEPVIMRNREGCAGGGKGPLFSERSFTLATSNDQIVFYGNRVDDIRIQGDVINTLQARMGTGGGNMPLIFDNSDESKVYEPKSAFEENWAESEVKNALRANASKSSHAVVSSTVRRLTPMECERLQGFPDSWTKFDAQGNEVTDGHRYKQMGNAVAVPVVSWIVNRLMVATNDMD